MFPWEKKLWILQIKKFLCPNACVHTRYRWLTALGDTHQRFHYSRKVEKTRGRKEKKISLKLVSTSPKKHKTHFSGRLFICKLGKRGERLASISQAWRNPFILLSADQFGKQDNRKRDINGKKAASNMKEV